MDDKPAFFRDPRRLRRSAFSVAVIGAFCVIVAMPTNSRVIVAVGLILVVLAHALVFLSYLPQTREDPAKTKGAFRRPC